MINQLWEIVEPLLEWFDDHARILPWRENPSPYFVWVSEIMLQQTRVEAVKPYFDRWVRELPTLEDLAEASEDSLLLLWEGLGYYNRVRNLQKAARIIIEKYHGVIPSSFDDLLTLPGIGEYTAGAVSSIAFQQPVPCVDGNVLRVATRMLAIDGDIGKASVKASITKQMKKIIPEKRSGDFNQAMMELGALICLPNGMPKCPECPLSRLCTAYQRDQIQLYPVKQVKKPRSIEDITVLMLLKDHQIAIRKRGSKGLLAGLWEFPNFDGILSESSVQEILHQTGFESSPPIRLKDSRHIFTHKEWRMTGYLVRVIQKCPSCIDFKWVDPDQLNQVYALPTAFKPFVSQAKKIGKE